jgi:hypothetical protein
MRKWMWFVPLIVLYFAWAGCSAEHPPAPQVQTYNSVIGLAENRVTSMYIGYQIGPGRDTWEFTTKERLPIKTVIDFLKKQEFRSVEKRPPSQEAVAVDVPYSRFSFALDGSATQNFVVTFLATDNGEGVDVNGTGYIISSSKEELDKLFLELKPYNK